MNDETLSIGEIATRSGFSVSAIRFYESSGLLPEPERVHGRRRYGEDAVRRLGLVGAGKRAGLSLEEIGALLASADRGTPAHAEIRALAARKLPEVEALIEHAETMRAWLVAAGECECRTLDACVLFTAGEQPEDDKKPASGIEPETSALQEQCSTN